MCGWYIRTQGGAVAARRGSRGKGREGQGAARVGQYVGARAGRGNSGKGMVAFAIC